MKLSEYAKKIGVTYKTAWNHYQAGLIPNARKLPSGIIIIDAEISALPEKTAVYARVSSSENKTNLISQSKRVQEFCSAKGWVISVVAEECGSGLNDGRKKLMSLLKDKSITRIVVEHWSVVAPSIEWFYLLHSVFEIAKIDLVSTNMSK